jgi:hypothetical protein
MSSSSLLRKSHIAPDSRGKKNNGQERDILENIIYLTVTKCRIEHHACTSSVISWYRGTREVWAGEEGTRKERRTPARWATTLKEK